MYPSPGESQNYRRQMTSEVELILLVAGSSSMLVGEQQYDCHAGPCCGYRQTVRTSDWSTHPIVTCGAGVGAGARLNAGRATALYALAEVQSLCALWAENASREELRSQRWPIISSRQVDYAPTNWRSGTELAIEEPKPSCGAAVYAYVQVMSKASIS